MKIINWFVFRLLVPSLSMTLPIMFIMIMDTPADWYSLLTGGFFLAGASMIGNVMCRNDSFGQCRMTSSCLQGSMYIIIALNYAFYGYYQALHQIQLKVPESNFFRRFFIISCIFYGLGVTISLYSELKK